MNDHKMEIDGNIFIKVTGFCSDPCPYTGDEGRTESMWVLRLSGDDDRGTGILDNDPSLSSGLSAGDIVEYEGGTDDLKPWFVRKIGRDRQ